MHHFKLQKNILHPLGIFIVGLMPFSFVLAAENFVTLVPSLPIIGKQTDVPSLLNGLFAITVGIAAILAVLEFIIGGFQYMSSEALSQKGDGRSRMESAVLGLILILVSILILNTINPDITSLNIFRHVPAEVAPPDAGGGLLKLGSRVEKTVPCPAGTTKCCEGKGPGGSTLISETPVAGDKALCVFEIVEL